MSLFEKLLNKSNSYVYYKKKYNELSVNEKVHKKEIELLKSQLEDNKEDIKFLKGAVLSSRAHHIYCKDKLDEYKAFEQRLDRFNDLTYLFSDIKQLNIAYVLNSFPAYSETFVVNEVRWLVDNGYNVIVLRAKDADKPIELDFHVKNYLFEDSLQLENLLIENNIDLIHTHFIYPTGTNYTYPIAEKLKIPFTIFAHAFDLFVRENAQANKVDEMSKSKYCKAIFTLSQFHKDHLMKLGALEDKIVITKQATNYELLDIQPKTNKIKKIISISRFVEKKGLDVLIDAAKLLENEDYEFSIYGFGVLEEDYRKQIEELGCKNIEIKDELHPDEVQNTLLSSDLLVAPSKVAKNGDMDGIPTVVFEAMASGLPILTTKVSAIPEIITDGENGFLAEPENPEEIAEKIREISNLSNDKLFEIRKKAQEDVKNISSVDKTMNRYIETLQRQ